MTTSLWLIEGAPWPARKKYLAPETYNPDLL